MYIQYAPKKQNAYFNHLYIDARDGHMRFSTAFDTSNICNGDDGVYKRSVGKNTAPYLTVSCQIAWRDSVAHGYQKRMPKDGRLPDR